MASIKQNLAQGSGTLQAGSVCILIVDDQEFMRTALRRLLETQPFFKLCGEACNGYEAVQKAMQLKPEAIVMDINMPGLDGLEATRRIRKALPNTEILIFTQHELLQVARAAEDAGARGCVSKLNAAKQLVPALETVCQHKPYFPLAESIR